MPGITDPAQEYFKDGLWGWVTDQWKKLIADAAGHLQVDVVESGLPDGGATSANQASMITALELIDDLRTTLHSVHSDELDIIFDGQTVEVEVKQIAPADLTPGVCGWIGSAWQKLPIVWGYSEHWEENLGGTKDGDGTYSAYTVAVPAGYVYKLDCLIYRNDTGTRGDLALYLYHGVTYWHLLTPATPDRYQVVRFAGPLTLAEDNRLRVVQASCLHGDVIRAVAVGYKMKIAE